MSHWFQYNNRQEKISQNSTLQKELIALLACSRLGRQGKGLTNQGQKLNHGGSEAWRRSPEHV